MIFEGRQVSFSRNRSFSQEFPLMITYNVNITVCICVCTGFRMCVRVWVILYIYTYYIYIYIHMYIHIFTYTYNSHTHTHTHTHTYVSCVLRRINGDRCSRKQSSKLLLSKAPQFASWGWRPETTRTSHDINCEGIFHWQGTVLTESFMPKPTRTCGRL